MKVYALMLDSRNLGKQLLRVFKDEEDANNAMCNLIHKMATKHQNGLYEFKGIGYADIADDGIYVAHTPVYEDLNEEGL